METLIQSYNLQIKRMLLAETSGLGQRASKQCVSSKDSVKKDKKKDMLPRTFVTSQTKQKE
ncbi:unnamed protein product [Sphenostylis stenocarpa]|uniref:Uncharacterized protein n=1 Tax=Sphenostylis stenocarpa TaxID=92480 RepID=A0AA86VIS9_9FABA|nr:unnamed protein product [Sphenostylis stenocarpa]